jgi:hypothetical protein
MEVTRWVVGSDSYATRDEVVSASTDAVPGCEYGAPFPFPPMPHTDPIVLGLLLVSLIGSLVYQWRRGLRGGRLAVVSFAMFYALSVIVALGMHCVDVLYALTHRLKSFGTGKTFGWDWHTYSLLLFGVLMIWLGARCLRHALRMGRGDVGARTAFLRLAGVMLVIVLPLIPIQAFFAVVASALSVIALLVVGPGGRRWARSPSPISISDAAGATSRG